MKSLLFHCRNYRTRVGELADRPATICPEPVGERERFCHDCVVALITVERGDVVDEVAEKMAREIEKMARDVGRTKIVLLPFAHLSSSLADSTTGIAAIKRIAEHVSSAALDVERGHFGSHKELLIDLYGHPGNTRFREF